MANQGTVSTSVDLGWLELERARYEHLLDDVTRLPKWALLIDRLTIAIARTKRTGNQVALLVIDDPHIGHSTRDLPAVVSTLRERIRADDTLARIGMRRFAVVCNEIRANEDAARVARRLIYDSGLVCRLGVALGGIHESPESLIGRALAEAGRTTPN
jgi:GGDEF domain-containing protein